MKYFFVFFFSCFSWAQFELQIVGKDSLEASELKAIAYKKKHENVEAILNEVRLFEKNLSKKGWFFYEQTQQQKTNDSTFVFGYSLGERYQNLVINASSDSLKLIGIEKKIVLKTDYFETWTNALQLNLEKKGFVEAGFYFDDFVTKNDSLHMNLVLQIKKSRAITALVFNGYDAFPKGVKKVLLKRYKKRTFTNKTAEMLEKDLKNTNLVTIKRNTEVLFTKDSTNVFLYVEKKRQNSFDGFVGFANNETTQKLQFNGFIDLKLQNNLNSAERFELLWRNDGNKQSLLNAKVQLNYILGSALSSEAAIKIFKQDSIFQNSSSEFNLGYKIHLKSSLFFGLKSTTSESIAASNASNFTDLKARFYTAGFEYNVLETDNVFFRNNFLVRCSGGIGNRTANDQKTKQFFVQSRLEKVLKFNAKNALRIQNEAFFLNSNDYFINEQYIFGGLQSIRGFRENSLFANALAGIYIDYNYLLSSNINFYTLSDFAFFKDDASATNGRLYSLGLGLGIANNNGIFNLVYANGFQNGQSVRLSNSIFQISFTSNF